MQKQSKNWPGVQYPLKHIKHVINVTRKYTVYIIPICAEIKSEQS